MDEVLDYLKKNVTYYLATIDEDGNPRVRPFGTISKYNGELLIQTGNVKDCFKQMAAHPRVELCAFDDKAGTWLRVAADAIPVDSVEAREFVLDEYPSLKPRYAADDGNCEVLALRNVTAQFCSFTTEPRVVTF